MSYLREHHPSYERTILNEALGIQYALRQDTTTTVPASHYTLLTKATLATYTYTTFSERIARDPLTHV